MTTSRTLKAHFCGTQLTSQRSLAKLNPWDKNSRSENFSFHQNNKDRMKDWSNGAFSSWVDGKSFWIEHIRNKEQWAVIRNRHSELAGGRSGSFGEGFRFHLTIIGIGLEMPFWQRIEDIVACQIGGVYMFPSTDHHIGVSLMGSEGGILMMLLISLGHLYAVSVPDLYH